MELNDYIKMDADKRLEVFMSTLSATNRTPEFYINWSKVAKETKKFELELNTLNYLIGKENIRQEARHLFMRQPELLKAIPSLLASRDRISNILILDHDDNMSFQQLNFSDIEVDKIEDYLDFMEKSGLLNFLQNIANRSLVDYVYGVEAGLDSNARKNRGGTIMEGVIERHAAKIAEEQDLEWRAQATASFILQKWGLVVPVDKSARRFDVAIYSKKKNKVWLIETNFYSGGGSKLKAVAGEFTELNQFVKSSGDNVEFVWITDGQGWKTARLPLSEAFGHMTNIFNLKMLRNDFLSNLIED